MPITWLIPHQQIKQNGCDGFAAGTSRLYKEVMDIISRAAPVTAVERIFFLIKLCQCSLDKGCGGSQKGCHPHPEYGARSA